MNEQFLEEACINLGLENGLRMDAKDLTEIGEGVVVPVDDMTFRYKIVGHKEPDFCTWIVDPILGNREDQIPLEDLYQNRESVLEHALVKMWRYTEEREKRVDLKMTEFEDAVKSAKTPLEKKQAEQNLEVMKGRVEIYKKLKYQREEKAKAQKAKDAANPKVDKVELIGRLIEQAKQRYDIDPVKRKATKIPKSVAVDKAFQCYFGNAIVPGSTPEFTDKFWDNPDEARAIWDVIEQEDKVLNEKWGSHARLVWVDAYGEAARAEKTNYEEIDIDDIEGEGEAEAPTAPPPPPEREPERG